MSSKIRSLVREIERRHGASQLLDEYLPDDISTDFKERRHLCPSCRAEERKRNGGENALVKTRCRRSENEQLITRPLGRELLCGLLR